MFPYRCDHPHNALVVVYRLEDNSISYETFGTFLWDARNADERFDSGASALQAGFLKENLLATQIYP